jgi:hypothetical protein
VSGLPERDHYSLGGRLLDLELVTLMGCASAFRRTQPDPSVGGATVNNHHAVMVISACSWLKIFDRWLILETSRPQI